MTLGQGAGFTSLDWAREQFIALFGIDPHPGTFNIEIQDGPDQLTWDAVRSRPGNPIIVGEPGACDARGYPIRIEDTVFGAIVLPEVSGYPERQIEIIAAVPIRDHLSVTDGAMISIGGDFLYTHEQTGNFSLDLAHVECVGDWQWLEVGGTDVGLVWQLVLPNNFGYQQLIIGAPDHASVVGLIDIHDNLQPGVADALYLFGGLRCMDGAC